MTVILNTVIVYLYKIRRAHGELFPTCKVVAKDIGDCVFSQTRVSLVGTAVLEIHLGWWIAGHQRLCNNGPSQGS